MSKKQIKNSYGCITKGDNLLIKDCGGEDQEFIFNGTELRGYDKCVKIDPVTNKLILADDCEKWTYSGRQFKRVSDNNFCIDMGDDKVLGVKNCTDQPNQYFDIEGDTTTSQTAAGIKIFRDNMVIPEGMTPLVQYSNLEYGVIMLVNGDGKNITVKKTVDSDRNEYRCLKDISRLVISPLTSVVITTSSKTVSLLNNSFEHDLIYDYQALISQGQNIRIDVEKSNVLVIESAKKVESLSQIIPSGQCMITKKDYTNALDLDSFEDIKKTPTTETEQFSCILGQLTTMKVGKNIFCNSTSTTIVYKNIVGLNTTGAEVYISAPINSGYAVISANCEGTEDKNMLVLGNYLNETKEEEDVKLNPIAKMKLISHIELGPYTKITTISNNETKVYENSTPFLSKYNLCEEKRQRKYDSMKVELSDMYVGFGLVSLGEINYGTEITRDDCETVEKVYAANCVTSGITELTFSNKDGDVMMMYTCDSVKPKIDEKSLVKKSNTFKLTSQDDFTSLDFDCGESAMTAVKVNVGADGNVVYEYSCGQKVSNIKPYESEKYDTLDALFQKPISCKSDNLNKLKISKVDNKFQYTYSCGKKVEGFSQDDGVVITYYINDGMKKIFKKIHCPMNGRCAIPRVDAFVLTGSNVKATLHGSFWSNTSMEINGYQLVKNKNYDYVSVSKVDTLTDYIPHIIAFLVVIIWVKKLIIK